jgi:hypothetical protein
MGRIFRDDALERRFIEESYLVVPFLEPHEIAELRRFFDDLHPDKLAPIYSTGLSADAGFRQSTTARLRAVCNPHIAALFSGYRSHHATFIMKEPGEKQSALELHIDPSMTDESLFVPAVNLWCALSDVTVANGALHVVPGTEHHASATRPYTGNGGLVIGHPFGNVKPLLKTKYARDIEVSAGEAVIFSTKLLHGSAPNLSGDRRIAFHCLLTQAEAPLQYHLMNSPTEVEVFEVDDAFFRTHQLGTRPRDAKSLGVVKFESESFTEADVLHSPYLRPVHSTVGHQLYRRISSLIGWGR